MELPLDRWTRHGCHWIWNEGKVSETLEMYEVELTVPEVCIYFVQSFHFVDPDVSDLIQTIHKKKISAVPALEALFSNYKKSCPAEVKVSEFHTWSLTNPVVITPMLVLQFSLRKQVIGEKYWKAMAVARKENAVFGDFMFTRKLQQMVKEVNDQYALQRLSIKKDKMRLKRRGLGVLNTDSSKSFKLETVIGEWIFMHCWYFLLIYDDCFLSVEETALSPTSSAKIVPSFTPACSESDLGTLQVKDVNKIKPTAAASPNSVTMTPIGRRKSVITNYAGHAVGDKVLKVDATGSSKSKKSSKKK